MMYCLRAFLPLLLLPLPLSLSPIHLTPRRILTYILNKPCPYCSLLLVILFTSSCQWSGRCFWGTPFLSTNDAPIPGFAASANTTTTTSNFTWLPYFLPRLYTTPPTANAANSTDSEMTAFLLNLTNSTISTLASSAASSVANSTGALLAAGKFAAPSISIPPSSAAVGVGTQWLRNLLGAGEWTVPCVGVKLVL